jgi:photosystem II stability/assembly factor-like uncharacterized protein|tara:strand:+ start:133260 stop:134528 length:1269 start_codon:yes stop_codon:yes gene_type:complete
MKKLLHFTILLISTFVFSQENWNYLPIEITNNYHGAIYTIDENIVHVVSDDGVFYKTENGGETWTQFDSSAQEFFFDLAFDGLNNGYAVGGNGNILKTGNGGETWNTINSGTTEALVSVAVNAQNSIWVVGDNGTVLHSIDGGNSWTSNNTLTIENLNDVKFKDESIGYIVGDNGTLLYTENAGNNWEELAIPATDDLSALSINGDFIYLLSGYANSFFSDYGFSGIEIYKSNNNVTWAHSPIDDFLSGASDLYFLNDDLGYMVASDALLCDCCYVYIDKTIDSGVTWTDSYYEETNAANCNANVGYADIIFPSEDVGYVLLGSRVLKTPYETAGVEDFNKSGVFTIYPNPTVNSKFNLQIDISDFEGISIEILDINGKRIFTETSLKKNNSISLPNISEGIYFINLLKNRNIVGNHKLILR